VCGGVSNFSFLVPAGPAPRGQQFLRAQPGRHYVTSGSARRKSPRSRPADPAKLKGRLAPIARSPQPITQKMLPTKEAFEGKRDRAFKACNERKSELLASPGIARVYKPSPGAINFIIDFRDSDLRLSIAWAYMMGEKDHFIEVALLDNKGIAPVSEVAPSSEDGAPKRNFVEEAIWRHHTGEYPLRKNPIAERNSYGDPITYQAYDGREVERDPFMRCPLDEAISFALKLGEIFAPDHEIKGGD